MLERINVLGLKAMKIGIYKSCKKKISYMSELCYDNVTAVNYFNNMGDIKSQTCNNFVCRIQDFYAKN